MPQWRKLHVKVCESLDVNDMPDDFHRLLWVLLPTQLCRDGRGVDSPSWVRSRVFPLREDVTLAMISDALDWFTQRGMIERYQVEGRSYFWVPTFATYQGNTSREGASQYPPPPEPVATYSRPTHDLLTSSSVSDVDADADVDADSDAEAEVEVDAPAALAPAAAEPRMAPVVYASALAAHGILVNGAVQAQMWGDLFDEAGADLFNAALDEAARASPGTPTLKYVDAIITRCLRDGSMPGERRAGGGARASPMAAVDAAIEEYGRQERERKAASNGDG